MLKITMCKICENQRRSTINKMSLTTSISCHHKESHHKVQLILSKHNSNYHNNHMHTSNDLTIIPVTSVSISQSKPNKSVISNVLHNWQYATKIFNRKWIYRYLLTLFILMYAINSSPILLSNAQMLKTNRTPTTITQNLNNNKITLNSGTSSSSVTQKTLSRSSHNNNIRKEYPDNESNERSTCQSCRQRKEVEERNLISFTNHILQRLQLIQAPNISMESISPLPESVLSNFYSKYGERYIRLNGKNYDDSDGMMSDEPKRIRTDKKKTNGDDDQEDEDEQFFSSTQSIYSFPNGKWSNNSNCFCCLLALELI